MKKKALCFLVSAIVLVSLPACSQNLQTRPLEEQKPVEESSLESEAPLEETEEGQPIVWLGDSLTQGSLGDENDNLPNAPYEKLKAMVDVPVEGYGMYAYTAHDILWTYKDESRLGQKRDPGKTYIFWIGSNDWASGEEPNTDTTDVIKEIDAFISDGVTIPNYIVVGTTARHELNEEQYTTINKSLQEHFKEHYLDVVDVIGPDGYVEDRIHLTQEAYDAVAVAVFEKLKELGYI